ncbi:MAG: hypothetical protein EHM58_00865 [Ignavibacteriae bacterium]|nr:MAG: hypothetical protein EHM58_00865 [Ignavibacteriota bacterium]
MPAKDKRIDEYIAKSQDFAKPILTHIREVVHKAIPGVEETMKWSFPHFVYEGETLCSMASFKQHCAFGFWKASLMKDPHKIMDTKEAMGHLGKITSVKDLPSNKIFTEYLKEAAKLNEQGVKVKKVIKPGAKKEVEIPDYFMKSLKKNKTAFKTFEEFSPSHKREYVEWITEAKTDETKNKRLETAIEWMAEGKIRNWKYVKK